MDNKKLVPQIRFKGFNDEWMQKTLEDISTYKASTYNIDSALKYGKYSIFDANNFIGYVNKYLCNKDYIAIIKDGSGAGRTIYMKAYSNFIGTMGGIIPNNNINPYFLYSLINTINFKQYIKGATIPHIYYSNYSKHFIFITIIEEQQKIGHYFYKLDEYINLNKKKIKKLLNIKNALLKKMFPNNDSKVPEIRFKGFIENWEKKKLEDIANFLKGFGLSKNKINLNGRNNAILYGELYTTYSWNINNIVSKTNEENGVLSKKGDVLMPCSTTTSAIDLVVASSLHIDNVLLGGDISIIRPKIKISSDFLALLITYAEKKNISEYAQGTTIIHLYGKDVAKITTLIPSLEEQEKIGKYFYKLDKLISLYEKEIEKLTNLKKVFLKKMFI